MNTITAATSSTPAQQSYTDFYNSGDNSATEMTVGRRPFSFDLPKNIVSIHFCYGFSKDEDSDDGGFNFIDQYKVNLADGTSITWPFRENWTEDALIDNVLNLNDSALPGLLGVNLVGASTYMSDDSSPVSLDEFFGAIMTKLGGDVATDEAFFDLSSKIDDALWEMAFPEDR